MAEEAKIQPDLRKQPPTAAPLKSLTELLNWQADAHPLQSLLRASVPLQQVDCLPAYLVGSLIDCWIDCLPPCLLACLLACSLACLLARLLACLLALFILELHAKKFEEVNSQTKLFCAAASTSFSTRPASPACLP